MTEQDMSLALGLLVEPEKNRLGLDTELQRHIQELQNAFTHIAAQKSFFGTLQADLWAEFLPWSSLN